MLRGIFLLLAALGAAGGAVAAVDVAGTVTILEGEALITRAAGRLRAAEGVRLQVGDIVETGDGTFMQVELVDQTVLQIGPKARIMVGGPCPVEGRPYVVRVERLVQVEQRAQGRQRAHVRVPLAIDRDRAAARCGGDATQDQRGDVVRRTGRPQAGGASGRGRRSACARARPIAARPAHAARSAARRRRPSWPRCRRRFAIRCRLRADKYREREVQPRAAPDFAYADVEPWLKAEPPCAAS